MVDFSHNIIKFDGKVLFSCGFKHRISRTSLDLGLETLNTFGNDNFDGLQFFFPPNVWLRAVVVHKLNSTYSQSNYCTYATA